MEEQGQRTKYFLDYHLMFGSPTTLDSVRKQHVCSRDFLLHFIHKILYFLDLGVAHVNFHLIEEKAIKTGQNIKILKSFVTCCV